jgi:3'(2'), 5'-bisphosphate nucleotidase
MVINFSKELNIGIKAVMKAALICQIIQQQKMTFITKADLSPVTVADMASQATINLEIKNNFPNDPIISEETSLDLDAFMKAEIADLTGINHESIEDLIDYNSNVSISDRWWTIDPIDGTKGFINGRQYAICLALLLKDKVKVAIIGCPNLNGGTLFYAVEGEGSWEMPLKGGEAKRISVSDNTHDLVMVESVEKAHSSHSASIDIAKKLNITRETLRIDSQAKYGIVARGDASMYLRIHTVKTYQEKVWDHAAGVLLVREAGGVVTDWTGQDVVFEIGNPFLKAKGGVICCNSVNYLDLLVGANSRHSEV